MEVRKASSTLSDELDQFLKLIQKLKKSISVNLEYILPRAMALIDSVKRLINQTNKALLESPGNISQFTQSTISEVVGHTRSVLEVLTPEDRGKKVIEFGKNNDTNDGSSLALKKSASGSMNLKDTNFNVTDSPKSGVARMRARGLPPAPTTSSVSSSAVNTNPSESSSKILSSMKSEPKMVSQVSQVIANENTAGGWKSSSPTKSRGKSPPPSRPDVSASGLSLSSSAIEKPPNTLPPIPSRTPSRNNTPMSTPLTTPKGSRNTSPVNSRNGVPIQIPQTNPTGNNTMSVTNSLIRTPQPSTTFKEPSR
eukprot:TRINITY_DN9226_c0_g1_i1.p1 TRINITY_DN9226_c0_g1~~TRINITY_DN9226_c0_g1_i1.p1  ORF type:complete len:348 (-),score=79.65 TRINITY_DN9226_c0_g1_i1:83-1012(-)